MLFDLGVSRLVNFLFHKKEILAQLHSTKANYYAGQYFAAGDQAAELVMDLVGPMQ